MLLYLLSFVRDNCLTTRSNLLVCKVALLYTGGPTQQDQGPFWASLLDTIERVVDCHAMLMHCLYLSVHVCLVDNKTN